MSNLFKYGNAVIKNDDKLVIDSNKLIEKILSDKNATANYASRAAKPDPDGFVCGLDAATVEQLVDDEPYSTEEESARAMQLLDDAREKASGIVKEADEQAEAIRKDAYDNGYAKGMEEAQNDAKTELEAKLAQLEKEYHDKKAALQTEYDELKGQMEPELADTILDVVSKVTGVLAEDNKDVILHLINNVMRNNELSKEFTIRVSENDYNYVISNKELIYGAASPDYNIEICKDSKLSKNQCVIETDAGVFDCSLDIQLENLIHEIKILSCVH